jgi:hypothetical protein
MVISRLALLALALTSLSPGASADPDTHRRLVSTTATTTTNFGSCAKGPCIRQAGAHSKALN